ncbi:hypothetical protein GFB49_02265 [Epibacterium sp. SM1979]|uniref:Uncharacterized protein n=1 Tax=Tritonibacter litoralis TaxID=2662264 RepID=A0A843Y8D7_9RHOB|nr:hypothetical protein [Tritonibacter litoralis]MQQ07271.1 hypothetical protein [Tritonibacter litoralis]
MKKLAVVLATAATPALAHPGHAELPGAAGHTLAHILLAVLAAGIVWAGVQILKSWRASRQEE